MKFVTIKQDSQLVLDGIKFDVTWNDGSISSIVAADAKGNIIRFAVESYTFKVTVPAPPKMVKRYHLAGSVLGMGIEKYFEEKYEAEEAMRELQRKVRDDEDCELSVAQVEVPEEVSA